MIISVLPVALSFSLSEAYHVHLIINRHPSQINMAFFSEGVLNTTAYKMLVCVCVCAINPHKFQELLSCHRPTNLSVVDLKFVTPLGC